jgi:hypothetical protein
VLVDESAEAVVALDLADGWCRRWLCGLWWLEPECAVRPVDVVMLDEDAQRALEVAAVEDRQPGQAFGADGSDEPLGDRVCLGRPYGRRDDPDAAGAEDLVERAAVLAVTVADREPLALVGEVEAEVSCLLG